MYRQTRSSVMAVRIQIQPREGIVAFQDIPKNVEIRLVGTLVGLQNKAKWHLSALARVDMKLLSHGPSQPPKRSRRV